MGIVSTGGWGVGAVMSLTNQADSGLHDCYGLVWHSPPNDRQRLPGSGSTLTKFPMGFKNAATTRWRHCVPEEGSTAKLKTIIV